jgi:hypothetical protein
LAGRGCKNQTPNIKIQALHKDQITPNSPLAKTKPILAKTISIFSETISNRISILLERIFAGIGW